MSNDENHWPRYAPVGVGLHMPELVQVSDDSGEYEVEVDVVPDSGRLIAREVRVRRKPGGPAVTGEGLRTVQVAALTKAAVGQLLEDAELDGRPAVRAARPPLPPQEVARLRENGPTTETLQWVAYLYRVALLTGEPPTKAVQTTLGLPVSTAGRWVAAARKAGHLGAAEGSGKAGG